MDAIKTSYLKENGIREFNPRFKYFKVYGMTPMFYSEEYFESHTIEELQVEDKKNADYFSRHLQNDETK